MTEIDNVAERLRERARWLVNQPEFGPSAVDDPGQNMSMKGFPPGFIGFGQTREGQRVLLATTMLDDQEVTAAVVEALRERGAKVDVVVIDNGPDRPLREDDELRSAIRREPWSNSASCDLRRHYDIPWITDRFEAGGYDLLIQGRAAALGSNRWEGHPWTSVEMFLSEAVVFPRDLHLLINEKAWGPVWRQAKGARVRVTDPEGTDFSWTLHPSFWEADLGFSEAPCLNHLMLHPIPPLAPTADASGVVAGTTAHFTRPFPQVQFHVEAGRVQRVEGGGLYGDGVRALLKQTREIQYPEFPRPGLLWFWEAALGTNPKVARPTDPWMISSGGTEWERWRAGALHFGFGTCGPSPQEAWAAERGIPYGHIHVHTFFATIEVTTPADETIVVSDQGRLTAFDDPEVRKLAATYGDPDEVLAPLWTPPLPGVSIPGDLNDYLREPARWFGTGEDPS